MWCLETIVAINNELAGGVCVQQAYKNCGIIIQKMPIDQQTNEKETTKTTIDSN